MGWEWGLSPLPRVTERVRGQVSARPVRDYNPPRRSTPVHKNRERNIASPTCAYSWPRLQFNTQQRDRRGSRSPREARMYLRLPGGGFTSFRGGRQVLEEGHAPPGPAGRAGIFPISTPWIPSHAPPFKDATASPVQLQPCSAQTPPCARAKPMPVECTIYNTCGTEHILSAGSGRKTAWWFAGARSGRRRPWIWRCPGTSWKRAPAGGWCIRTSWWYSCARGAGTCGQRSWAAEGGACAKNCTIRMEASSECT